MKWRGWATGVAVVIALLMTSCSGQSETGDEPDNDFPLTYLGTAVVGAEETLTTADAVWDRTQRGWNQVITVPDEARCYFLADQDGAIQKDGMCGPFRGLGTAEPEWVLLPFDPQPRDDGAVELAPTVIIADEKSDEYESLTLVRADGTEGDRDLAVPEPSGWPKVMKSGHSTIPPSKQFKRTRVVKTRVRMLGHDYTVMVDRSAKAQFPDRSMYVPKKGGMLAEFGFAPFDSTDADAAEAALFTLMVEDKVTLVVTAGGRTYRGAYKIPEKAAPGDQTPAYGPSGFFGIPDASDVSYAIVVKGKRFELTN